MDVDVVSSRNFKEDFPWCWRHPVQRCFTGHGQELGQEFSSESSDMGHMTADGDASVALRLHMLHRSLAGKARRGQFHGLTIRSSHRFAINWLSNYVKLVFYYIWYLLGCFFVLPCHDMLWLLLVTHAIFQRKSQECCKMLQGVN